MAQLSIPERRKAFKDRTLLAGHPVPAKGWYRNTSPTGSYTPMPCTKENFIRGFFLSRGDFYIIRDEVVEALKQNDIYKIKNLNEPTVMFDSVWPIFSMVEKHPIMSHPVPMGWKYHMIFKFIYATAAWMRELDENNQLAWPCYPAETWGPARQVESQKSKTSLLSSDSIKQIPYTLSNWYRIKITVHDPDPTFFLPSDLSFLLPTDPLANFPPNSKLIGPQPTKPAADDKAPPPRKETTSFHLTEIVDCGDKDLYDDDEGFSVEQMSFKRLQDVLDEKKIVKKESAMKIYFAHPLAGNRMVAIENDEQLRYAMDCMLPYSVSSIDLVAR